MLGEGGLLIVRMFQMCCVVVVVGCNTMESSHTRLPTFRRNLTAYEALATPHSSRQECGFLALTSKCRRAEMWRGR